MNELPFRTDASDKLHWQLFRLSWGAIIAGCVVALSVHLLLAMLGIGLGVRMVNPFTDENPVLGFTAAVGIAWSISALISLWLGDGSRGALAGVDTATLAGCMESLFGVSLRLFRRHF